jgi:hypothetical protein
VRVQLRPPPTRPELDRMYAGPHQHAAWADHRIRVDVTVALGRHFLKPFSVIADLSCGDAAIAQRLAAPLKARTILGDYAPGYPITGPIELTAACVDQGEADLWICCETLEHLSDPDAVLRQIRPRTAALLLSTPEAEMDGARNPEHVWGWDAQEVERMLRAAGFTPSIFNRLDLRPAGFEYSFQIWACR